MKKKIKNKVIIELNYLVKLNKAIKSLNFYKKKFFGLLLIINCTLKIMNNKNNLIIQNRINFFLILSYQRAITIKQIHNFF